MNFHEAPFYRIVNSVDARCRIRRTKRTHRQVGRRTKVSTRVGRSKRIYRGMDLLYVLV